MEDFLAWYTSLVIVDVEVEIVLGKEFNIAVPISYVARSTEGCRSMTITDLAISAWCTRGVTACGSLHKLTTKCVLQRPDLRTHYTLRHSGQYQHRF